MNIIYNNCIYSIDPQSVHMERKEKSDINRYWQSDEEGLIGSKHQKAMSYIDDAIREHADTSMSIEYRRVDGNFNAYVEWFFSVVSPKTLCRLANTMYKAWGRFSKDLCMRFLLCNLFEQYLIGFEFERRFMEGRKNITLYKVEDEWDDNINDLVEILIPIGEVKLDRSHGIDCVCEINGRIAAVQIKTAENLTTAVDNFYNQKSYKYKYMNLEASAREFVTKDGKHPAPVFAFIDRNTDEIRYDWLDYDTTYGRL